MHFNKIFLLLIESGQNDGVKAIVKGLNYFKEVDEQGKTLLHYAAVYGNLEITEYLLQGGSDVNFRDQDGETALTRCLEVRQHAVAQFLLEAGADCSCLLHSLVLRSDAKGVKLLLNFGADVDEVNSIGATPVFYSYMTQDTSEERELANLEILQMLLNSGASLMTFVARGCFQITTALFRGSRQAVRLILHSNIDFKAKDKLERKTILHYIAMNRNFGIAEELIPYIERFDINALDDRNGNPLREAVSKGNVSMVEFFLDNGARVDFLCHPYRSSILWTVFDNAKAGTPEEYEKCIELLLQHDINPQATMINTSGQTLTMIDLAQLTNGFDKLKLVIARMAINEKQGILLTEPTHSKIHSHPQSKAHLKKCRRLLKAKIAGSHRVYKLLTLPDKKMKKYLSKKKLIKKLMRINHKLQLKSSYKYYSNTLEKRFTNLFLSETLKDRASKVICQLLEYRVNESNIVTEKIIGYLNNQDLRQLCNMHCV